MTTIMTEAARRLDAAAIKPGDAVVMYNRTPEETVKSGYDPSVYEVIMANDRVAVLQPLMSSGIMRYIREGSRRPASDHERRVLVIRDLVELVPVPHDFVNALAERPNAAA